MSRSKRHSNTLSAAEANEQGIALYQAWELEQARALFQSAAAAEPDNPEYHLNLARTYARGGAFHDAIQALGDYLRTENDDDIATRYELMFSSAMDEVESGLIDGMRALEATVPEIGKAIQMWLEYRICIGRRPLEINEPAAWSAALAYAMLKINMHEVQRRAVARQFGAKPKAVGERFNALVDALDLMPGDYRYFTGDENPLDRLLEAAEELDQIYQAFYEE